MKPTLLKEERNGWPAQSRPDRKLPGPWTMELLVSINRVHHHALSPNGDQVAFVWEREGHSDLWLAATDGTGWAQRLTLDRPAHNYWEDASPNWSPDGQWLVYASQGDIWSVPSAGGKARRLTDYRHGDSSPIVSPGVSLTDRNASSTPGTKLSLENESCCMVRSWPGPPNSTPDSCRSPG